MELFLAFLCFTLHLLVVSSNCEGRPLILGLIMNLTLVPQLLQHFRVHPVHVERSACVGLSQRHGLEVLFHVLLGASAPHNIHSIGVGEGPLLFQWVNSVVVSPLMIGRMRVLHSTEFIGVADSCSCESLVAGMVYFP